MSSIVIRNEYLIFTLSESLNPWVYSLQFLFKSTNNHGDMKENVSWVFFLNTAVYTFLYLGIWQRHFSSE